MAAAAKHTRNASAHNDTRCAKDQQIHTEPNAVNVVRLPPCSTSPLNTEGSAHASTTIGAIRNRDGRSQAANGYSTASAKSNPVSTLLSLTSRAYSITATTASAAASIAVVPRPIQIGMPTTGAISTHVVHFWINSRLRDASTAIPAITRITTVTHMKNTDRACRWMCSGPRSTLSGNRRSR